MGVGSLANVRWPPLAVGEGVVNRYLLGYQSGISFQLVMNLNFQLEMNH